MKLWNIEFHRSRADGGWHRILDYQVPLKASLRGKNDKGVGKIDLLSVTDKGRLVIHELKVMGRTGSRGDSPAAALMQALCYAAIVDANFKAITREILKEWGIKVASDRPTVQILACEDWWDAWRACAAAGNWESALKSLSDRITEKIQVPIECMALDKSVLKQIDPECRGRCSHKREAPDAIPCTMRPIDLGAASS